MPTHLRYHADDRRDPRLDWIRGYAVLAMSINHFGLDASVFLPFTGGSVFLINAAEVFFFISGLTLGLISARRETGVAVARCFRRAWEIWVAVLILAAGGVLLGESGWFVEEPFRFLGVVMTMQEAPNWGDVLVAYVLYMLFVPIAIVLLKGARVRLAVCALAGVYALSQLDPEGLQLPFASFRNIAANAPIFFGGLLIGWHRDSISAWWVSRRWSTIADALVVAMGIGGLAFYIWGGDAFAWGEGVLERFELGRREYRMPPECLAVVFVYLRCLWLLVDRLWLVLDRSLGWLTRWVGRSAMTAYVAHAMVIPIAWWIVGVLPFEPDADSLIGATAITTLYMVCVLALVAACRFVMARAHEAPERFALSHLAGPATACVLLVVALALHGTGLRPLEAERWDEEGESWVEDLEREMYGAFSGFDTESAALIVRVWWVYEDDMGDAFDELAEIVEEVVRDELDSAPESVRVTSDSPAIEIALIERGFAEDPGTTRVALFEMIGEKLEDDDMYERVVEGLQRVRDEDAETLAILVVRLTEE